MLFALLLVVIGGVICFLLLTPLVIEVDSIRRKYGISYKGIAAVDLLFEDGFFVQMCILGWRKTIEPFGRKEPALPKEAPAKRKRRHFAMKTVMRKARAVLRTFKVKYFYMNIDTDDHIVNAWLYPLAVLLTKERRSFRINFNGDVVIRFRIENRLGKMLFALIR